MNQEEHKLRHQELHKALDELLIDFIINNKGLVLNRPIKDLTDWSYDQTHGPDHEPKEIR